MIGGGGFLEGIVQGLQQEDDEGSGLTLMIGFSQDLVVCRMSIADDDFHWQISQQGLPVSQD